MVAIVKEKKQTLAKKDEAKKVVKKQESSDSDSDDSEVKISAVKKEVAPAKKVAQKKPASDDDSDSSSESEEEVVKVNPKVEKEPVKKLPPAPAAQAKKVEKKDSEEEEEEEDEEEEKMIIHPKNGVNNNNNGFNKKCANSADDDKINSKLTDMAHDVKSSEAQEKGDFKNFNLPKNLIEKLKSKNVTYLYPIQIATLKHIRAGDDVIAQARTGTGKTFAFAIPIIEKLEAAKPDSEICKSPKCLVLEPTRELAKQVGDDFQGISTKLRTCCVYGGVSYERQEADLRKGVDILAGTPGRILDFINSGNIDLGKVEHVILDEVDRMLDMGFQESVEDILKSVYTEGRKAQTLFFSATCPPWVKRTAQKYISDDFKFIDLIGDSKLKTATTVEHLAIQCSYHDRASTIGSVLQVYSGKHGRAMIFCQTKKDADELACSTEIKQESHVLHGDVPQVKMFFFYFFLIFTLRLKMSLLKFM